MKCEMICRIFSLVLVIGLVFSLTACSGNSDPTEVPTEAPTEVPTEAPTETPTEASTEAPTKETLLSITEEGPITHLDMSMGETDDSIKYMSVFDNGDGTIYVEYVGEEKKVAEMDAALMNDITAELDATGLAALFGRDNYDEGEAFASMYIEFADRTAATVGYSGTIPQEFIDGYNTMDAFFQRILADAPVYVPQVQVMDADPDAAAALVEIMNGTGFEDLDSFWVADVAKDDLFGITMGLSSYEGIANATQCMHSNYLFPFSVCMATLVEGADAEAVIADFAGNADWDKLVYVYLDNALVAQKGNRVLCLMGSDELYTKTAAAVQAAGWTVVKELERPDK